MTLLYDAGFQLVKVRAVTWFALLCALGSLGWGYELTQTYGLAPGDGGVLRSSFARGAWGSGVALLGGLLASGMWLYGRCYVARILYDRDRQTLHVETLTLMGRTRQCWKVGDMRKGKYHPGYLRSRGITVDAPWWTVRVKGRRLPLMVDARGKACDAHLLGRLVFL